jgi:hypothetical protein
MLLMFESSPLRESVLPGPRAKRGPAFSLPHAAVPGPIGLLCLRPAVAPFRSATPSRKVKLVHQVIEKRQPVRLLCEPLQRVLGQGRHDGISAEFSFLVLRVPHVMAATLDGGFPRPRP